MPYILCSGLHGSTTKRTNSELKFLRQSPLLTDVSPAIIVHSAIVAFQALRSELNIVYDTTTGRDLSERSELSRLNVEQLQCFMNGAAACGFLLGYSPSTALHVLLLWLLPQAKLFRLWLVIRFLIAFFGRSKKAVMTIKKKSELLC